MKNKRNVFYSLLIILAGIIYSPVKGQQKNGTQNVDETKFVTTSHGPNSVVSTIRQDKKGNIWLASAEGIIRYDGKSFTNITGKMISARFVSVLEDAKGSFWFATVGSGVYYYNEKTFRNFRTRDGLANNRVACIYKDKAGNIWFGTQDGASRYDGSSFQNLKMKEGTPPPNNGDSVRVSEVNWVHNDVNAILEDKTGKFWFGTRGDARVYDGKTFTTITNTNGNPFTNVRSIIEDRKGNIWLGGNDGLWRYDGHAYTSFTKNIIGYIYQDKKGNIWISSESANSHDWILSRYDEKSLTDKMPVATDIYKVNKGMLFGILEANDGSIWFGATDGVYRYDGKTITNFKSKDGQQ